MRGLAFGVGAAVLAVAPAAMAPGAIAQQDFDAVEIETIDLGSGVYMMVGAGGNLGVSVGDDATVLIDDQFSPLTDKINAAIAALSDNPVEVVINTHWHFDHTGGNENYGNQGAMIFAHDNVRVRMSGPHRFEAFDMDLPASPDAALPVVTYDDGLTLHLNGQTIDVIHVDPAHTDGDSIVVFREANVVHLGDVFFNGLYPFVDQSSDGSVAGVIAAAAMALDMIDDDTKVIPGHGPLATKADLQAYHDMLVGVSGAIQAGIDAGQSLEEIIDGGATAAYDEAWSGGFLKGPDFVTILYGMMAEQ